MTGDEGLGTNTGRTQARLQEIVRNYSQFYKAADPRSRGAIVETVMLVMKKVSGPERIAFLALDRTTQKYREAHACLILKRIDKMFTKELGLPQDIDYEFSWSHPSSENPPHQGQPHVIFPSSYKPPTRRQGG